MNKKFTGITILIQQWILAMPLFPHSAKPRRKRSKVSWSLCCWMLLMLSLFIHWNADVEFYIFYNINKIPQILCNHIVEKVRNYLDCQCWYNIHILATGLFKRYGNIISCWIADVNFYVYFSKTPTHDQSFVERVKWCLL